MKKALKSIVKVVIVLVIIGGLGYGGYRLYLGNTASTDEVTEYTQVQISTGSIQQTVTGTGSLSISETQSVSLSYPVTVKKVSVQAGQEVSTGDTLAEIDQDALKTAITTLNTEISDLNSTIASLTNQYSDTSYITTPVSGRVKAIYAAKGDMTQTVVSQYDCLVILSTDGKMKVTAQTDRLSNGDTVNVLDGSYTYTGTVEKVENGMATITFSDQRTLEGANVSIVQNNILIADGVAQINMPYAVSTSIDGYISDIYAKVNSKYSANGKLFYVTNVPADTEYDSYISQLNEKQEALKAAKAALVSGVITSPVDGIVSTVPTASNEEVTSGTEIASIYVGDAMQMIISVDELDITNVAVGLSVSIAMDAVDSTTYNATVAYVSQIGTNSSGVTTYSVTLDVQGDSLLKMGMNGTATISIGEVSNVVLVPISALNTSKDGQYVWLYSENLTTDEPGIKTFVTTGLSNDSYAQVVSGLSAGDIVMVTRSADTSSSTTTMTTTMGISMDGATTMISPSGGSGDATFSNMGGGEMPSGGRGN